MSEGDNDIIQNGVQRDDLSRFRALAESISRKSSSLERNLLAILRYSALALSSILLIVTVLSAGLGVIKQFGSDRVEPKKVSLTAKDVAPPETAELQPTKSQAAQSPRRTLSSEVRKRTISLYRSAFRPFERSDTKIDDEAVLALVWPQERIDAYNGISAAGLNSEAGVELQGTTPLMLDALATVEKASKNGEFSKVLTAFRDAKKVRVCTDRTRTRTREVSAWDSYSTSCTLWYESPVGCRTTRLVDEPYTESVCEMKFPDGLEAPTQILSDAVRRYSEVASARLTDEVVVADRETAKIKARKIDGQEDIVWSGKLFMGFLALMFLYLFIVMERHHRALRALAGMSSELK